MLQGPCCTRLPAASNRRRIGSADFGTPSCDIDAPEGECEPVSRGEFALAMLVRQDKVSVEDIRAALETFDALDASGDGYLGVEDLAEAATP